MLPKDIVAMVIATERLDIREPAKYSAWLSASNMWMQYIASAFVPMLVWAMHERVSNKLSWLHMHLNFIISHYERALSSLSYFECWTPIFLTATLFFSFSEQNHTISHSFKRSKAYIKNEQRVFMQLGIFWYEYR